MEKFWYFVKKLELIMFFLGNIIFRDGCHGKNGFFVPRMIPNLSFGEF